MVVEIEADNVGTVFVTERLKYGAPGMAGGGAGALGAVLVDGEPIDTRRQQTLMRGNVVTVRTPGGGGYGGAG